MLTTALFESAQQIVREGGNLMCLRRRWRCELLNVSEQFWSDEVSNHNIYSSSLKSFFGREANDAASREGRGGGGGDDDQRTFVLVKDGRFFLVK